MLSPMMNILKNYHTVYNSSNCTNLCDISLKRKKQDKPKKKLACFFDIVFDCGGRHHWSALISLLREC